MEDKDKTAESAELAEKRKKTERITAIIEPIFNVIDTCMDMWDEEFAEVLIKDISKDISFRMTMQTMTGMENKAEEISLSQDSFIALNNLFKARKAQKEYAIKMSKPNEIQQLSDYLNS